MRRISNIVLIVFALLSVLHMNKTACAASGQLEKIGASGWYYPTGTSKLGNYYKWWRQNPDFKNAYHLGADIQSQMGAPVYAIGDGKIVYAREVGSYKKIGNKFLPGGVMIIEHKLANGKACYSLYGHVQNYKKSGNVAAGEQIAQIGQWDGAHHLHFGLNTASIEYRGYTDGPNDKKTYGFVDPISFLMNNPANKATPPPTVRLNNPIDVRVGMANLSWVSQNATNQRWIVSKDQNLITGLTESSDWERLCNEKGNAVCRTGTASNDRYALSDNNFLSSGTTLYWRIRVAGNGQNVISPVASFRVPSANSPPNVPPNVPPTTPLPKLTNIKISPDNTTVDVSKTQSLSVTGYDQQGKAIPMSLGATWASSNMTVGTIDNRGVFTAKSGGNTTITATSGSIKANATITVKNAVLTGWQTDGDTAIQKRIVTAARAQHLKTSGQSVVGNGYQTDIAGGDGARMLKAITIYHEWKKKPGTKTLAQIQSDMGKAFAGSLYGSAQVTKLVAQITLAYKPNNMPRNEAAVLEYLGIRKQCHEWADYIGGGEAKGRLADLKKVRPGMGLFSNLPHAMIITDVNWQNGVPVQFKVCEANWATGWINPKGAVPWERTVNCGRTVSANEGAVYVYE